MNVIIFSIRSSTLDQAKRQMREQRKEEMLKKGDEEEDEGRKIIKHKT